MAKYKVTISASLYPFVVVEVEADNPKAAKEAAMTEFVYGKHDDTMREAILHSPLECVDVDDVEIA